MFRVLALAVAAIVVSPMAQAATVQLSPVADNTLFEDEGGALSNGAGEYSFVGVTAMNLRRRALTRFDFSLIPAGSTITGVTLRLNMSRGVSSPTIVTLHRALSAWGEGTSDAENEEGTGAPSTPGDATWKHTVFNTATWTTPGGDFDQIIASTVNVGGTGFYTWPSTPLLVAQAQAMLDAPVGNFGWLLLGDESSSPTAKRFDTRENAAAGNRPVLSVDYVIPAPGCTALLGGAALLLGRRRRRGIV